MRREERREGGRESGRSLSSSSSSSSRSKVLPPLPPPSILPPLHCRVARWFIIFQKELQGNFFQAFHIERRMNKKNASTSNKCDFLTVIWHPCSFSPPCLSSFSPPPSSSSFFRWGVRGAISPFQKHFLLLLLLLLFFFPPDNETFDFFSFGVESGDGRVGLEKKTLPTVEAILMSNTGKNGSLEGHSTTQGVIVGTKKTFVAFFW